MIGSAFHLGSELYYIYWKSDWKQIAIETYEKIENDKMNSADAKEAAGPTVEM
jgi:hypothetical protein